MSARAPRRWLVVAAFFVVALFATPLFAVSSPQDVRLPPLSKRDTPPPALFSHWSHSTQQCFNCHPSVFAQASFGFTHAQMKSGQFCGACHDGQLAKSTTAMRCEVCHVP